MAPGSDSVKDGDLRRSDQEKGTLLAARALSLAMRAFSQLLDDLVYTRSRNGKLRLIGTYLKETPDPDRGLALAALTGTLDIPAIKPAVVRALAQQRIDPVLLQMSRDYVGDALADLRADDRKRIAGHDRLLFWFERRVKQQG